VVVNVHLGSGAWRKSDDSNPRLLCPNVFVYERLHVYRSTFEDATNIVLGGSLVHIDYLQHYHVFPML